MTDIRDELLEIFARHQAFWDMAEVDRPLICASHGHPLSFDDFQWGEKSEGELTPEMIDVSHLENQYESRFESQGLMERDGFWGGEPPRAIPWMEAIMGCPVHFSTSGRSIWAEPVLENWTELEALENYRESPWLSRGLELTRGLVELSGGRFPIIMFLQRGPLDVAAAVRGLQNFCLDLFDHPEEFERLLDLCTEANLYVAKALAEIIPLFHGGHTNLFGLWSPGWPYLHQQDAMASFSPDAYEQAIRVGDEVLMGIFDHSIRKFHSSSLHILEEASSLAGVRAVQITIDPTGPTLDELIPIFSEVQQRKPLILNCTSREAVAKVRDSLSPRGLYLYYWKIAGGLAKLSFDR